MPLNDRWRVAGPGSIGAANVSVTRSSWGSRSMVVGESAYPSSGLLSFSSAMVISSSAALRVIEAVGRSMVMSISTSPEKVAPGRSGVRTSR